MDLKGCIVKFKVMSSKGGEVRLSSNFGRA